MQQLVAQAEATSCVGARCCVPRLGQAAGGEDLERGSRDSHDLLGPLPVGQGNIHAGHEATKGHRGGAVTLTLARANRLKTDASVATDPSLSTGPSGPIRGHLWTSVYTELLISVRLQVSGEVDQSLP